MPHFLVASSEGVREAAVWYSGPGSPDDDSERVGRRRTVLGALALVQRHWDRMKAEYGLT